MRREVDIHPPELRVHLHARPRGRGDRRSPSILPCRESTRAGCRRSEPGPNTRSQPDTRYRLPKLDRDGLQLGVMLDRRFAVLAALTRHLEAAERRRRVDDVVAVDPDGAGLDLLGVKVHLSMSLVQIAAARP